MNNSSVTETAVGCAVFPFAVACAAFPFALGCAGFPFVVPAVMLHCELNCFLCLNHEFQLCKEQIEFHSMISSSVGDQI